MTRRIEYGSLLGRLELALYRLAEPALWLFVGKRTPLRDSCFSLAGETYKYFLHPYNHTWMNERAVEIAIARRYLEGKNGCRILEIGNVLSHYGDVAHPVLDKFESSSDTTIINQDLMEFSPSTKFDLIISVSTIEHIDFSEPANGVDQAASDPISKVRSLLSPGGEALLTWPVGFNPQLDRRSLELLGELKSLRALRRVNALNEWEETAVDRAVGHQYGHPFRSGNAVMIACLEA